MKKILKSIIAWILGHPCEYCCGGMGHYDHTSFLRFYGYRYLHSYPWHKPHRLLCRLLWEDDNFWCKVYGHEINAIETEMHFNLKMEELEKNKGKDYEGVLSGSGVSNLSDDMSSFAPSTNIPFTCKRCSKTI